jgi:hypothetical protein
MLSMADAQAVENLADLLYEFLPGSGNIKTSLGCTACRCRRVLAWRQQTAGYRRASKGHA